MIEPELYESVQVFKELFDNMGSGVFIYETYDDGNSFVIKEMNESGLSLTQVEKKDIIGKNILEVFPGIKDFGLFEVIQRVWKTGEPEHIPPAFYQDDRISGWTENYVYKLPSGKIVAIFEEFTDRIEAEENLKKRIEFETTISTISSKFVNPVDIDEAINSSLKNIGIISQASRSYLFLFNEDNITMNNTHEWCAEGVNPQLKELQNIPMAPFQWSIDKLKNNEILNIENIENLPLEASAEKEEFLRENIKSLIFLPLKIGEIIAGFIGFDNIRAPESWQEEDLNLLKISSDIIGNALKRKRTELELEELNKQLKNKVKKTTEVLKESEEKFRMLADQSLMGIFIMQGDKIVYANHKMADIIGYPYEEAISWNLEDQLKIVHPDDREFIKEQALKKQKGKTDVIYHYQFRLYRKTGELAWIENYSKTITYDGKPADFVTFIDITDQKKMEEKIKKSEKKYRKAYYQANLYRDIFAHDINNILQNVSSSVELSSLYLNNPEKLRTIKELYEIIDEQVHRAKKLIRNVRKITEIDESEINLERIDATRILNKAIEFLESSFQTRNINIQLNTPTKRNYVYANNLLLDVFENILINAVRYNDKSNININIDISKEQKEDKKYTKMEFKDNGIGISDYRKESIFEKGMLKNQKSKGMGLGLSLVKKIIDIYHGEIWVEDRVPGDYKQGRNFVILIPSNL